MHSEQKYIDILDKLCGLSQKIKISMIKQTL